MKSKIQYDIKQAMRSKDTVARDVLRVLIGEIERAEQTPKGKIELGTEDVQRIVKKMITNIKETSADNVEVVILEKYLPRELSRFELETLVDNYIVDNDVEGMRGLGQVMGYFGKTYPNQYDGKLLSTIIREVLQ